MSAEKQGSVKAELSPFGGLKMTIRREKPNTVESSEPHEWISETCGKGIGKLVIKRKSSGSNIACPSPQNIDTNIGRKPEPRTVIKLCFSSSPEDGSNRSAHVKNWCAMDTIAVGDDVAELSPACHLQPSPKDSGIDISSPPHDDGPANSDVHLLAVSVAGQWTGGAEEIIPPLTISQRPTGVVKEDREKDLQSSSPHVNGITTSEAGNHDVPSTVEACQPAVQSVLRTRPRHSSPASSGNERRRSSRSAKAVTVAEQTQPRSGRSCRSQPTVVAATKRSKLDESPVYNIFCSKNIHPEPPVICTLLPEVKTTIKLQSDSTYVAVPTGLMKTKLSLKRDKADINSDRDGDGISRTASEAGSRNSRLVGRLKAGNGTKIILKRRASNSDKSSLQLDKLRLILPRNLPGMSGQKSATNSAVTSMEAMNKPPLKRVAGRRKAVMQHESKSRETVSSQNVMANIPSLPAGPKSCTEDGLDSEQNLPPCISTVSREPVVNVKRKHGGRLKPMVNDDKDVDVSPTKKAKHTFGPVLPPLGRADELSTETAVHPSGVTNAMTLGIEKDENITKAASCAFTNCPDIVSQTETDFGTACSPKNDSAVDATLNETKKSSQDCGIDVMDDCNVFCSASSAAVAGGCESESVTSTAMQRSSVDLFPVNVTSASGLVTLSSAPTAVSNASDVLNCVTFSGTKMEISPLPGSATSSTAVDFTVAAAVTVFGAETIIAESILTPLSEALVGQETENCSVQHSVSISSTTAGPVLESACDIACSVDGISCTSEAKSTSGTSYIDSFPVTCDSIGPTCTITSADVPWFNGSLNNESAPVCDRVGSSAPENVKLSSSQHKTEEPDCQSPSARAEAVCLNAMTKSNSCGLTCSDVRSVVGIAFKTESSCTKVCSSVTSVSTTCSTTVSSASSAAVRVARSPRSTAVSHSSVAGSRSDIIDSRLESHMCRVQLRDSSAAEGKPVSSHSNQEHNEPSVKHSQIKTSRPRNKLPGTPQKESVLQCRLPSSNSGTIISPEIHKNSRKMKQLGPDQLVRPVPKAPVGLVKSDLNTVASPSFKTTSNQSDAALIIHAQNKTMPQCGRNRRDPKDIDSLAAAPRKSPKAASTNSIHKVLSSQCSPYKNGISNTAATQSEEGKAQSCQQIPVSQCLLPGHNLDSKVSVSQADAVSRKRKTAGTARDNKRSPHYGALPSATDSSALESNDVTASSSLTLCSPTRSVRSSSPRIKKNSAANLPKSPHSVIGNDSRTVTSETTNEATSAVHCAVAPPCLTVINNQSVASSATPSQACSAISNDGIAHQSPRMSPYARAGCRLSTSTAQSGVNAVISVSIVVSSSNQCSLIASNLNGAVSSNSGDTSIVAFTAASSLSSSLEVIGTGQVCDGTSAEKHNISTTDRVIYCTQNVLMSPNISSNCAPFSSCSTSLAGIHRGKPPRERNNVCLPATDTSSVICSSSPTSVSTLSGITTSDCASSVAVWPDLNITCSASNTTLSRCSPSFSDHRNSDSRKGVNATCVLPPSIDTIDRTCVTTTVCLVSNPTIYSTSTDSACSSSISKIKDTMCAAVNTTSVVSMFTHTPSLLHTLQDTKHSVDEVNGRGTEPSSSANGTDKKSTFTFHNEECTAAEMDKVEPVLMENITGTNMPVLELSKTAGNCESDAQLHANFDSAPASGLIDAGLNDSSQVAFASSGSFLTEFEKFVKKSSKKKAEDKKKTTHATEADGRRSMSVSSCEVMDSNRKTTKQCRSMSESRSVSVKSVRKQARCQKSATNASSPSDRNNAVRKSNIFVPKRKSRGTINVAAFLAYHQRLHSLRRKVCHMLQCVFGDLSYPPGFKLDSPYVDQFVDRIVRLLSNRSMPARPDCSDPKVVLCRFPGRCLRQLQRSVVHLLTLLLPGLELTTDDEDCVDILLEIVISANQTKGEKSDLCRKTEGHPSNHMSPVTGHVGTGYMQNDTVESPLQNSSGALTFGDGLPLGFITPDDNLHSPSSSSNKRSIRQQVKDCLMFLDRDLT